MKAAPRLAPQRALVREGAQARGDRLPQRLADGDRHVDADEVEQRERPERMRRAERHARVDGGRLQPRLLEQPDRAEQVREEQPVHDEAGDVRDLDGNLLERLAQGDRPRAGVVGGLGREGELDELHAGDRVEDVEADEAVGPPGRLRERLDRERRRGGRDDRVAGQQLVELGEVGRLRVGVLDDRLDDERRARQLRQIGVDLDAVLVVVGELGDALVRALRRRLAARPQGDLSVLDRDSREARRDGAASCDAQPFLHPSPPPFRAWSLSLTRQSIAPVQ